MLAQSTSECERFSMLWFFVSDFTEVSVAIRQDIDCEGEVVIRPTGYRPYSGVRKLLDVSNDTVAAWPCDWPEIKDAESVY
ncbi:unnamed protein product [Enterobius vermicularis]|uniref:DUF2442 domain-containing protein n=1 Tax=Enterobius vermicularis TaxID=51028 RepID=A0A0N4VA24_ENTVE|nr:unnamed protein product [Enterobius vermicularis]